MSKNRKKLIEKRIVSAFEKIRCATLYEMRKSIHDFEKNLSISDWNLISLYRFPLVTFPQKGTFIINLTSLGRSLFDGVRHSILTAALAKLLPDDFNSPKRVGGLYGQLFESYIMRLLEAAFGDRVIKISEEEYPGNADCLIYFPGKVLVVEIKSEHFVTAQHYRLMNIQERKLEIENVGVKKGIRQIESTIKGLKTFTLKPEEAYGEIRAELVQEVPRDKLPKEPEPKEGMMLMMSAPTGQQIPAKITKITEDKVTIDINHPLAGKELIFTVKVVGVNEPEEAQKSADTAKSGEKEDSGCGDSCSSCAGCQ